MSWDTPLARPLAPRDHAVLETLADARAYMLEMSQAIAGWGAISGWQAWTRVAELLLAAADDPTKAAIAAATQQLELAMFVTARTDLSADEALKRKKRRRPVRGSGASHGRKR